MLCHRPEVVTFDPLTEKELPVYKGGNEEEEETVRTGSVMVTQRLSRNV